MKVKIIHAMRGPGVALNPGDITDVDADAATRLIKKGIAEPVKARRRKTVIEPPNQAVIE